MKLFVDERHNFSLFHNLLFWFISNDFMFINLLPCFWIFQILIFMNLSLSLSLILIILLNLNSVIILCHLLYSLTTHFSYLLVLISLLINDQFILA
jgi:hypothetical protein